MTRDERTRAYRSLVIGVRELQDEWPTLPEYQGRINDLVGFLFATLPLSEAALDAEEQDRPKLPDEVRKFVTYLNCQQRIVNQGGSMSKEDPRPDQHRSGPDKSPNPPDNSETRPAEGGVGTDTKNDPANEPAAQPGKTSER